MWTALFITGASFKLAPVLSADMKLPEMLSTAAFPFEAEIFVLAYHACASTDSACLSQEQQAKTVETAEKGRIVQPSLLKALYKAYGLPYLLLGIIKLVNDILSFAGPVLLNVLIRYLETPSEPFESGIGKAADGQNQWAGKAANGHHQGPWLPATDSLAFGLCCAGLLGLTSLVKVSQCMLAVPI